MNKDIAILLPYKESYTNEFAGAASIWVKDYIKGSKFYDNTIIYGNLKKEQKPITNNFVNLNTTSFLKKNLIYTKNFYKFCLLNNHKVIEIHNRPESLNFFIKENKMKNFKLFFIFHNNPLELRGSKSVEERLNILEKTDYILFVSKWVMRKFFEGLPIRHKNNCEVLYPSIKPSKNFNLNKKKIIIFTGKLNKSKGYDLFLQSIVKILDKNKDWKSLVIGNEPREKYNITHKNLKVINWLKHSDILRYYKSCSISVVPSIWEEPFGRTALESAANGCATIITDKGGLKETFKDPIILGKNDSKVLIKIIQSLINDKKELIKIQKNNHKNVIHKLADKINKIDKIKDYFLVNKLNYFQSKNKKILHISTFDEKNSHRLFNISLANKITKGLIRNNHDVINFSYRDHQVGPLTNFELSINQKLLEIVKNYKPDLILLGHNNVINLNTLEQIKLLNKETKISLWYEDALSKKGNGPSWKSNLSLVENNHELIDNYFTTTHPNNILSTKIKKNKLFFLPMMVDENIEGLSLFKYKKKFKDLFFAISHGVNYGKLKRFKNDEREIFINKLILNKSNIRFNILGFANESPKWNYDYYNELIKCKMALNLSRGHPIKYSTSNRIASLVGNGIYTFIDEKVQFQNFFNEDEMGFYKNIDDLINKVENLKSQENKIHKFSKNGMKKYFHLFNNKLVTKYLIDRIFSNKDDKLQIWEKY